MNCLSPDYSRTVREVGFAYVVLRKSDRSPCRVLSAERAIRRRNAPTTFDLLHADDDRGEGIQQQVHVLLVTGLALAGAVDHMQLRQNLLRTAIHRVSRYRLLPECATHLFGFSRNGLPARYSSSFFS